MSEDLPIRRPARTGPISPSIAGRGSGGESGAERASRHVLELERELSSCRIPEHEFERKLDDYLRARHPKFENKKTLAGFRAFAEAEYRKLSGRRRRDDSEPDDSNPFVEVFRHVSHEEAISSVLQQLARRHQRVGAAPIQDLRSYVCGGIKRNLRQQLYKARRRIERDRKNALRPLSLLEAHLEQLENLIEQLLETQYAVVTTPVALTADVLRRREALERELLARITAFLQPKERPVYELLTREQLSCAEIARRLGWKPSTVRVYKKRCLEHAKRIVLERLHSSPIAAD